MDYTGNLLKMPTENGSPIQYKLPVSAQLVPINELIGKHISITWLGKINCIHCGRQTNKSFAQGYCYPCFSTLPETDECILHPEKCLAHEGISRDMAWSENHCLTDHFVYLALTDSIKIGVTRNSQIPTRWIDQGAWKAIRIAKTPNRYTAGLIEVYYKTYLKDKTNWRNMLTNKMSFDTDLQKERDKIMKLFPSEFSGFIIDDSVTELSYPVTSYPPKVESIDLLKQETFSGILTGIRGQYLMLENGKVMNIRKHGGFLIKFTG